MKKGSTIFLKSTVIAGGVAVLAILSIFLFPAMLVEDDVEFIIALLSIHVSVIPFFIALFQTMKLLSFIDKNKAFSELSVTALNKIKNCAVAISMIIAGCLPAYFYIAEMRDAPGVFLIGLIFTFAPVVIATFAAVLQKILQDAIDIKSENDLTV